MDLQIKKSTIYNDKNFVLITSILSFIISLLYVLKGFKEGFILLSWVVISLNFLYIPFALIFKRKYFCYYYIVYALVLIYFNAFTKTYLHNNYTSLFFIFIVILIIPRFKISAIIMYFVAVSIAYSLNEEKIYLYLLHIVRMFWFYYVFSSVLDSKYKRKHLVLYDDEIKILTQLSKHHLQKSIQFEGYSESTIYRRLKAAMKRNNLSKQDLIEEFKKEYPDLVKN